LPALTYARKRLRDADARPQAAAALARLERASTQEPRDSNHGSDALYEAVGELLLAVVDMARELRVDPEIALRRRADAL
jgi:uncharacterized protein YabN with tetrapyrrole methylase and pyrophosphatase domain